MNLKDINLNRIKQDSKNVFEYFVNCNFEQIEDFKNVKLIFYAEKHAVDYNEVLGLFQQGTKNGEQIIKEELEERKLISSEAGQHYLFEIATIYNIHAEYNGEKYKFYFRENFITEHSPEDIKLMGRVIGRYEYAWKQILKNHAIFEPLFKPEVEKEKNSVFNLGYCPYPCHNVRVIGLPDSMQVAKDFRQTLIELDNTLQARKAVLLKQDFRNLALYSCFNYALIPELREQVYQFLQETVNNTDNDVFEKYTLNYSFLKNDWDKCLATLKDFEEKGVFKIDMSPFPDFKRHNENWFKIIYEEFELSQTSYSYITKTDKGSAIKKIVETIAQGCVELTLNPESNRVFKKHFEKPGNRERENTRTYEIHKFLNTKLNPHFLSQVQFPIGQSKEQKKEGTVDLAVFFGSLFLIICEAVNTSCLHTGNSIEKNVKDHIEKLVNNYNKRRINNLINLIYYEEPKSGNPDYFKSFENYFKKLKSFAPNGYKCLECINLSQDYIINSSSVKLIKTIHPYSKNHEDEFAIYHFYIDFSENPKIIES